MSLCLHAGADPVNYDQLRQLDTPPATLTHVPIPHFRLVDLVANALGYYGHIVKDQHFGVTPDKMRFFGLLSLESPYSGYEDTIGLRNSHDKKFPVGISFGSRVFVCDNLAFVGDSIIRTKHTAKLKVRLPGLIGEIIEPLTLQREAQGKTFERYKTAMLADQAADHAIMTMFRRGIINVQRIDDVVRAWDEPKYAWEPPRSAWHLFNAATLALAGKVAERPQYTTELHQIIDGVCEEATLQ